MKNAQGKLLAAGVVVALLAVAAQVNPTPANAPAQGCDRDCYVNRKMAAREAQARDRYLADLETVR